MRVNVKDLAAGALFVAIGLAFALNAWFTLKLGEARSMGPGYFPVLLGTILAGFGIAIAARAVGQASVPFGRVSWRGVALVTVAIAFFAATVRGLGMAPGLGGATFLAALSSSRMSLMGAAILSAALTTLCIALFVHALQLPYPVIGPWLKG